MASRIKELPSLRLVPSPPPHRVSTAEAKKRPGPHPGRASVPVGCDRGHAPNSSPRVSEKLGSPQLRDRPAPLAPLGRVVLPKGKSARDRLNDGSLSPPISAASPRVPSPRASLSVLQPKSAHAAAPKKAAGGQKEAAPVPLPDKAVEKVAAKEEKSKPSAAEIVAKSVIQGEGEGVPFKEINPVELQLHECVGSGCTAKVYRAIFHRDEVACKQIDWDASGMGKSEQRAFEREVAIMSKVRHNNLVQLIGIAAACRPLQIVTEYCSGGCCFELLHNCDHIDLGWAQKLKMCIDVAAGTDYLHKFNPQIIHRDLKSLNLLLAKPVRYARDIPHVKVSDFGLARIKEHTGGAEGEWGKMTIAAGTCHWMAPEVVSGHRYDERADVYSYAMILFEIICREIPFEDEEPAAVGQLVIRGARPDLEAVPPDCPGLLLDLMIACWAADSKRRPPFSEILSVLQLVGGKVKQ